MVKARAAALSFVALLVACSSPDATAPQAPPAPSGAGPTIEAGPTEDGHDHGSHGGFGSGGAKGGDASEDDSGAGSGHNGASEGEGGSGGSSGNSGSGSNETGDGPAATAPYPAGGTYAYAQKGTEAFCDPSGRCERYDLPPTQRIKTSLGQRTNTEAIVVTEVESNGRYVRTSTHFTPEAAFVNEVYYRLVYEGLTLQEQYNPDPPVPQLRFPLRPGREWDASWKDDTSGDYHARVTGVESVTVRGGSVDAVRIETLTHFRGELRGKASVVIWFDPDTRAIVRTNGALNLSSSYGGYNTNFETTLKSAPGY